MKIVGQQHLGFELVFLLVKSKLTIEVWYKAGGLEGQGT